MDQKDIRQLGAMLNSMMDRKLGKREQFGGRKTMFSDEYPFTKPPEVKKREPFTEQQRAAQLALYSKPGAR